jgi:translation initiation factor 2-alpha kinase 4
MAPPKTPARKKNAIHVSTQSTPTAMGKPLPRDASAKPPLLPTPTEGYAQVQEDELEVLKAIYMDDFNEVEAKGAWSVRFYPLKSLSNT